MSDPTTHSPLTEAPGAVLDLRQADGFWCLLQIRNQMKLAPGEVLELLVSDPSCLRGLEPLLSRTGYQCLLVDERPSHWRLHVGPARPGPEPDEIKKRSVPMSQLLSEIPEVSSVVDARGSACPGPLLEAKKAIASVAVGQVLEVQSNDAGTKGDIPVWATKVGHEYLGHAEADGYERIFVRRKK